MGGCPRTFYSTGGLRTCPRHRRLLKLHAIYNPPLHLIAFLYSQLTPWYCFSKRVLLMNSIAFFNGVADAYKLTVPAKSCARLSQWTNSYFSRKILIIFSWGVTKPEIVTMRD